jgi:hypothetical protein
MTAHEFYIKIKSLELQKAKEDAVVANKDVIIKLNQGQLHLGRTFKDDNIEPKYSDLYLKRKLKMSSYIAEVGTPDIYVTGQFYSEMDIIVENGEYIITSFDEKMKWLTKYDDIFGVNGDNLKQAQIPITNTFLELITNQLNN